ncbi:MAG: hypothetical protein ACYTEQ_23210 [Planctomycetota bacterium]|jgi:DNA-binding transcriptional regulator YhcF (GntR family)
MGNLIHPSRWRIRPSSKEANCKSVYLPLGNSNGGVLISTATVNRAYREWGGRSRTNLAGDFAVCLKELRQHDVKLAEMKGVNAEMVGEAYSWLELYELEVQKFAQGRQEEIQKQIKDAKNPRSKLHETIYRDAIVEYIRMGGPMGSPEEIIRKAKALADEFEKQEEADAQ